MLPYTANSMIIIVVVAGVIHVITLLYIYVVLLLHILGMLPVMKKQYNGYGSRLEFFISSHFTGSMSGHPNI